MQTISQTPVTKYNIKERLQKMPGSLRQNIFKLCLHCDIGTTTLYKWMKTPFNDNFSIASDQFYQLADFFNCNPTDLKNG